MSINGRSHDRFRMTNKTHTDRVVYSSKHGNEDSVEFFMYAEPGQVEKWRKDKTIPLIDVLQSFQVFESNTKSPQGIVMKPSNTQLMEAFGTTNETEIATLILEKGKISHMKQSTNSKGFVHPS
jgi:ribosome maturation protein Sdo1